MLAEKGAAVFRFKSQHWMPRGGEGTYVPVAEVVARFPARDASELVAVFRLDLDGDRAMDVLLVADNEKLGGDRRFAPTVLRMGGDGYEPSWAADQLPGERFRLVDARDLNRRWPARAVVLGPGGQGGLLSLPPAGRSRR